jgi:hypothetical protein
MQNFSLFGSICNEIKQMKTFSNASLQTRMKESNANIKEHEAKEIQTICTQRFNEN